MNTIRPINKLMSVLVITSLLVACANNTLAPEYHRPAAPVASQWPSGPSCTGVTTAPVTDISWQTLFAEPGLHRIINLALENNRDLRIATLNIEKARAQYNIQRSELLPTIGIDATGSSGRTPASISTTGTTIVGHAYHLDVGISAYELDLFGRVRSLKEQALQQYLATEAAQRSARISLIAEVASTYLNLTADSEQLALAHQTLANRQTDYDLQLQLRSAGNSSELELRQAEAELESARDQVLISDNAVSVDRNALELLAGTPLPTDLHPTQSVEIMLTLQGIPAGLPSVLLLRRPDIVAAEHSLIAANANIGAARAAFFPSIQLTAGVGRASNSLSSLFDGGNQVWNFAPQINLPIFTGGRLSANLNVVKVERDIAVADYERSIQAAFREVADALEQRTTLDGRLIAQQRRADAAQTTYILMKSRYDNGISSYLDVLDAQRTLYSVQQNLIVTRLARQTNLITLYKSLGGDWNNRGQAAEIVSRNSGRTIPSPAS